MSSSQYSPIQADSNPDSGSEQSIQSPSPSITPSIAPSSSIQKGKRAVDYNSPDYKLEPDSESPIYIFKNGLFTRTLLPIEKNQERCILIRCTL